MRESFQVVLLEIEAGTLTWEDVGPIDLLIKQAILDTMVRLQAEASQPKGGTKQDGTAQSPAKRKLCVYNRFQRGACTESSSHSVGRWTYHHACAPCLKQTDELLQHPASACTRQQPADTASRPKYQPGAAGGF